jgi:hypothetical protein
MKPPRPLCSLLAGRQAGRVSRLSLSAFGTAGRY